MSIAQATVTDRGKNKLDSAIIWQTEELILSDKQLLCTGPDHTKRLH